MKKVADKMRNAADRLMFGGHRKASLFRLFSTIPIAVPLILWAAVIEQIPINRG